MGREEYWNNGYLEYWNSKLEQSTYKGKKIMVPGNDVLFQYIDNMDINQGDTVLDFGCSSCRIYQHIQQKQAKYYGIDISQKAIEYSKNAYPELKENLFVSEGEKLQFIDNIFDKVICFGVFDACYQEEALYEILRVLKLGGKAFITGKNINYCSDDEEAYIAELNARKKGHPNYFTDLNNMIKQLKINGFDIKLKHCFKHRGDFTENKYTEENEMFYEYAIIIEKTNKSELNKFKKFSDKYSNTYLNIKNEDEV